MLDLFSGIGGFALAAEWVWGDDLDIVAFVEIDKFCQKVLRKYWADVPIYGDVRDFSRNGTIFKDEEHLLTDIDLITGGFPCQDISVAGKGAGIDGGRSGLWYEYERIIGEVRPRFALIENVTAITVRGLDRVLCGLAKIGYDAEWQCISAAEVGAWHRRERIWILAYSRDGADRARRTESGETQRIQSIGGQTRRSGLLGRASSKIPNTECQGFNEGYIAKARQASRFSGQQFEYWQAEPELGRVAHGIPDRVDRLKSLGNAIVPQVAYIIMQQLRPYI